MTPTEIGLNNEQFFILQESRTGETEQICSRQNRHSLYWWTGKEGMQWRPPVFTMGAGWRHWTLPSSLNSVPSSYIPTGWYPNACQALHCYLCLPWFGWTAGFSQVCVCIYLNFFIGFCLLLGIISTIFILWSHHITEVSIFMYILCLIWSVVYGTVFLKCFFFQMMVC